MDTMIELPALRRSAELAPNTVDNDARTVEVIWSAGARVRRARFRCASSPDGPIRLPTSVMRGSGRKRRGSRGD
jgi:hypothetical protein